MEKRPSSLAQSGQVNVTPARNSPLPPIKFGDLAAELLRDVDGLLPKWLPGGKLNSTKTEYVCGSLSGGAGGSCSVNIASGVWMDFQTGDGGPDLISLYGAIHDLRPGPAARQLAIEFGLERVAGIVKGGDPSAPPPPPRPAPPPKPQKPAEREGWRAVVPVPDFAPEVNFWHQERQAEDIEHTAEYRVGARLYGFVVRFRTSDGGKETLPRTFCTSPKDGGSRWHWKTWDEPRPLYLPSKVEPGTRTVILVEGEKKADALQALLDANAPSIYCVVSWPGGCKAWAKADWTWLKGSTVMLWPDCDAKRVPLTKAERDGEPDLAARTALQASKPLLPEIKQPGTVAMRKIGAVLRDTHDCSVQLLPIPKPGEKPDGWDCADAIADGWGFDQVQALFQAAFMLPADASAEAPPPASAGGGGDGKKIEGPANGEDGGPADGKLPWWLRPYWDADKCRWHTSRKLVIAALKNDEYLQGILGLNELSNNIEARRLWPWPHCKVGPITSVVDLMLGQYLTDTYGLPSIPRVALMEAIETIAHAERFHPVRDYLAGLQHDGKSRIDSWLIFVIGETPDSMPKPVFEYLSLVGRYWLLGMVNRVMNPGCKFDYCPVLEGPGGLGKSTVVEALAGAKYFSDTHFDVARGKEGQEQVQGLWLYEIAELANFGKAEIGLIKAFITAKVDRYRPSYGRTVEAYERQCVLVGTTNENTYLRDRTGNRRFWPVPVRHRINIPWVLRNRDQLFAESFALYQAVTPFTPTHQDEARLFVPMQESRLVETAVVSEMTNLLTREPTGNGTGVTVNNLTDFVTIAQMAQALGVDAAKSNAGLESQIRGWLDHEGWKRVKQQRNGVRAWGYARPSGWPAPEPDETPETQTPAGQDEAAPRNEFRDDDEPF